MIFMLNKFFKKYLPLSFTIKNVQFRFFKRGFCSDRIDEGKYISEDYYYGGCFLPWKSIFKTPIVSFKKVIKLF